MELSILTSTKSMKKKINKILFLFFLGILLIEMVNATCNSTQININTASVEELEGIIHVGPVIAGRIIANRTYNSVDDLSRVKGIGNATYLADIKSEGLACVGDYEEEEQQPEDPPQEQQNQTQEEPENNKTGEETPLEEENNKIAGEKEIKKEEIKHLTTEMINLTPIMLNSQNSKDIKSEDNKEILKRNLSFLGIISLGIIFGVLMLINKNKNKNEFRQ
jgi:hypothetical protein